MDLFGEPETPAEAIEDAQSSQSILETAEPTEGLQHPRLMDICFAHESQEQSLLEKFTNNRMPHGIILSGPKGIGKATFAYRFARFLLAQHTHDPNQGGMFDDAPTTAPENMDIPRDHKIFKQVASGGHADLLTIERAYDAAKDKYKDSVAVDEVRKVNPFLRMTASTDCGWRVVIIDDADTMNRNAQNAILKILEEPPAHTVLILVCHRLGAMIPTIRSRTQNITFKALEREIFETLLERGGYTDLSAEQIQTLYTLSEGSIGTAIEYIEQGGLDTLAEILAMFENYPAWRWSDIHKLADGLARAGRDQSYKSFTELLPWIFTQMIQAKARGQNTSSRLLDIQAIQTLHKQSSLETLLKICENLKSHFDCVERSNLDKRQAVLGAFSIIAA